MDEVKSYFNTYMESQELDENTLEIKMIIDRSGTSTSAKVKSDMTTKQLQEQTRMIEEQTKEIKKMNEELKQKILDAKANEIKREIQIKQIENLLNNHWWSGFREGFGACIILSGIICVTKFLNK